MNYLNREKPETSRIAFAVLLGGLVAAGLILAAFPEYTVDDAYILFRYAQNFVHHGELNWNVGLDPVEGYTGIAMVLMLSVLMLLGMAPIAASKIIGISAFLYTGALLYQFARRLGVSGIVTSGLLALFFLLPIQFTHAMAGLETMVFGAAILQSLYLLYRYLESPESIWLFVSLPLSLLFVSLVRPEGVLLAGLSVLAVFAEAWSRGLSFRRKNLILLGLLYVLPGAIYFAWRWDYYGQFFPNTFYAKTAGSGPSSLGALVAFVEVALMLPLAGAACAFVANADSIWRRLCARDPIERRALLGSGLVAAAFVFGLTLLYLKSDLIMNYSHRFFAPLTPVLLLVLAFTSSLGLTAAKDERSRQPLRWRLLGIVLGVAVVLQLGQYARQLPREFESARTYYQMLEDEHVAIGHWLDANLDPAEWLVVVSDAGAAPYYSQLPTVDFGRLNDEVVRTLSDSERVSYFHSFNPGAAMFSSYTRGESPESDVGASVLQDDTFQQKYELLRIYDSEAREFYQYLYIRRDLLSPEVRSRFGRE